MSWVKDLKVGDRVFVVYSSRFKQPEYVSVVKVGRKWIELAEYTGRADRNQDVSRGVAVMEFQYGSPDCFYPDQRAFEQRQRIFRLRKLIEAGMRSITYEQTEAIAAIMGISDGGSDESQS